MPSPPAPTARYDRQDLVNRLLATTLQTRATIETLLHAAAVSPADQPQDTADLLDAAAALIRTYDNLLRAAGASHSLHGDDPYPQVQNAR